MTVQRKLDGFFCHYVRGWRSNPAVSVRRECTMRVPQVAGSKPLLTLDSQGLHLALDVEREVGTALSVNVGGDVGGR